MKISRGVVSRLSATLLGTAMMVTVVPVATAWGATTTATNVPCTGSTGGTAGLIAAITAANNAGGGTITLAPGCTYTVTAQSDPSVGAGLPRILSAITIDGRGSKIQRGATAPYMHLLWVDTPGNLTLDRVALTGGLTNDWGAGVVNYGSLTVRESEISHNTVTSMDTAFGGGIVSWVGSVTVQRSWIHDNAVSSNGIFAVGGGIYADSTALRIDQSVISGNKVTATGSAIGQGGGLVTGGSLVVAYSVIAGNTVTAAGGNQAGGGIYVDYGSRSLQNSLVVYNQPDNCYPTIPGCTG
jgi:hypothetical protein